MGWRFRKRVKIAPGIHLNFSKSGVSTTIGMRGASINIGPKGTYVNTGIPGTGLYNRQKVSAGGGAHAAYSPAGSGSAAAVRDKGPRGGGREVDMGCLGPLVMVFFLITFAIIYAFGQRGMLKSGGYIIIAAFIGALPVALVYLFFRMIIRSADDAAADVGGVEEDAGPPVARLADEPAVYSVDEDEGPSEAWPPAEELGPYDPRHDLPLYSYPPLDLLTPDSLQPAAVATYERLMTDKLIDALQSFGVELSMVKRTTGPKTILFELTLAPGVSVSRLHGLEEDLALALCASAVSIFPIPDRGVIGVSVPLPCPHAVSLTRILSSRNFQQATMDLPCAMGLTKTNDVFVFDLAKAPHLLIAGSAGQGKSVALHVIITSLLFKKHPSELKFVLIDPTYTELGIYQPLERHFLAAAPNANAIASTAAEALSTLASLRAEKAVRRSLLAMAGARDLKEYNELFKCRLLNPDKGHKYMPRIVVVIDAYNVLAMGHEHEMQQELTRLTVGARAVGIHLVVATNRPTSDIISSEMKSHIPTRISFALPVSSDSQMILDCDGAEELTEPGDMFFRDKQRLQRIQCAYVDTSEAWRIADYISRQQGYHGALPLPPSYP